MTGYLLADALKLPLCDSLNPSWKPGFSKGSNLASVFTLFRFIVILSHVGSESGKQWEESAFPWQVGLLNPKQGEGRMTDGQLVSRGNRM